MRQPLRLGTFRRTQNGDSGVAFIEAAIFLPILLVVTLAIAEFAVLFRNRIHCYEISREIAQTVTRLCDPTATSIANLSCWSGTATTGTEGTIRTDLTAYLRDELAQFSTAGTVHVQVFVDSGGTSRQIESITVGANKTAHPKQVTGTENGFYTQLQAQQLMVVSELYYDSPPLTPLGSGTAVFFKIIVPRTTYAVSIL